MAEKTLQEQFAEADEKIKHFEEKLDEKPAVQKVKKSFAPMRIGLIFLILLVIASGIYLVYRGISRVINKAPAATSSLLTFIPSSSLVSATVSPSLSTNRPAVVSENNVIPVSGRVLGASTSSGSDSFSQTKNQVSPSGACPDYLGDTIACVPPNYTINGMR